MASKFSLEVGDSIEIMNANGKHLHFIIAEASSEEYSSIILVYLSSSQTVYKDRTTIIHYGEHPYITKKDDESWIRYQNTVICSRNEIRSLVTNHYGKISSELLTRIQSGFENSTNISKNIKRLYFEWRMDKLFDSQK